MKNGRFADANSSEITKVILNNENTLKTSIPKNVPNNSCST